VLAIVLLAGAGAAQNAPSPPAPAAGEFTDSTGAGLLSRLAEALQGHSQKKFLALFDLSQTKDVGRFKQQISLFFSQTESIRVHLNLVETAAEGERATLAVDAEMELAPLNGGTPERQSGRLNFVAARAGKAWKFVDVEPRSFFSLP
jgi:uncharacterized protein (DUF736 family)